MEHPLSLAPAALTPTNDHFCDYATGPRLLAANHKNDTGRCATSRDLPISIRDRASDGGRRRRERQGVEQSPCPAQTGKVQSANAFKGEERWKDWTLR